MFKSIDSHRARFPESQLQLLVRNETKGRVGFGSIVWAGLSLFVILLTTLLLLLIDGRNVTRAAQKREGPWVAALEAEDWETARKLSKFEVDRNPRNAEAQHAFGRSLLELGRLDEAEVPLITAESLSPSISEYKVRLADLYTKRGVTQLAAGKLQEALDLDPSLVDLHWRLARALYVLKDYEGCLAELRIINRLEPDNWDAYRLTADVAIGRQKYQEAIDNLKLYTAVATDSRSWSRLASAYLSLNPPDTAQARRAAMKAVEIDPGDSQAHLALARINLIGKRNNEALEHYLKTAEFFLPARDAMFVSKIHAARKDMKGAEVNLRIAASIDTANKQYAYDLASNLMSQQEFEEAVEAWDGVLTLEPDNVEAWVNKGQAQRQAGDVEEAVKSFEKALETDSNNAAAHKAMGDINLDRGGKTQAKAAYQKALALQPDPVTGTAAAQALGYILWEEGDFGGAVPVLKKAIEFEGCNIAAILTLANCYQKLGQSQDGVAVLKKGLGCSPNDPQLRQALQSFGAQ